MGSARTEVRPTLDRAWLDEVARADPVTHAYAVWDLERFPDRVRFVSLVEDDRTVGYLLIWALPAGGPIVHWVAPADAAEVLAPALPPRPLVVVGPDGIRDAVEAARGPLTEHRVSTETADAGWVPPPGGKDAGVRPLTAWDREELLALASADTDRMATGYSGIDPTVVPIWGGFREGRLVSLANASVRLPSVWVVSGVYTIASERRQGWGRAVVRAVVAAAAAQGARCALYVPAARTPARALYRSLGFRPFAERLWLDAGANWPP